MYVCSVSPDIRYLLSSLAFACWTLQLRNEFFSFPFRYVWSYSHAVVTHQVLESVHLVDNTRLECRWTVCCCFAFRHIIFQSTQTVVHFFHVVIHLLPSSTIIDERRRTASHHRSLHIVHVHIPYHISLTNRCHGTYPVHVFFKMSFTLCICPLRFILHQIDDVICRFISIICRPCGGLGTMVGFVK